MDVRSGRVEVEPLLRLGAGQLVVCALRVSGRLNPIELKGRAILVQMLRGAKIVLICSSMRAVVEARVL